MRRFTPAGTLVVLAVLLLTLATFPHPPTSAQTSQRCFAETAYCIEGRIRQFWEQNGGLPVFGLPITPQREEMIEGDVIQVQWFERNRLELHPDNARPYDVLLGRLGVDALDRQGRNWFAFSRSEPRAGCRYFEQTGHNVCGDILALWQSNGLDLNGNGIAGDSDAEHLALFGLPLSGERTERLSDGREYTVQWFERARFELHPENAPPFDVLLGRLGTEVLTPAEPVDEPEPPVTSGPQHKIAFVSDRDGDNEIYSMNTDGSAITNLTFNPANDTEPAWSPDGLQLAFVSNRSGNNEIYIMNADGTGLYQLTFMEVDNRRPTWSPDGRRIAFASQRRGKTDIYTINLFGAGLTNLSSAFAINESPTWSADGSRIAFAANRDAGDWEIYAMNADGTEQQNISESPEDDRDPRWSPDGSRIVYVSNREGDWEVFTMNADGSNQRNITNSPDDDGFPAWSPDSNRIVFHSLPFVAGSAPNFDLFVIDANGRNMQNLTNHPANDILPTWSPVPIE
ncbi:MAG: hypothetical protein HC914_20690 [Chloroflexaceae bacterium]|nr:hypothetical protein [Chloroflexaceae bacterium]